MNENSMQNTIEEKKFSIVEALRFGFYTVIENILFFLGLWIIYISWAVFGVVLISLISFFPFFNTIIAFLQESDSAIMNHFTVPKSYWQLESHDSMALFVGTIVWALASALWYRYLSLGITRICLDFYDYKTSSIKKLFSGYTILGSGFIAGLIYAIISHLGVLFAWTPFIGTIIYFVLMIIMIAKFGFYEFILVDKRCKALTSLKESSQLTKGSISQIIGLILILICINGIAFIFFGIGLLITVPATFLAKTFVYRKLTHHSLAIQTESSELSAQQQELSTQ